MLVSDFQHAPHERLNQQTLDLFLEGFHETIESIDLDLQDLDINPANEDRINKLFRTIHTLKGDCFLCYMPALGKYVHSIEESISGLRSNTLNYSPTLKEALLISLDFMVPCAEKMVIHNDLDSSLLAEVANQFELLSVSSEKDQEIASADIIRLLGGDAADIVTLQLEERNSHEASHEERRQSHLLKDDQLAYFCGLSTLLESRNALWSNRTCTISITAVEINAELNNESKVDDQQLEAAVYLHDVGMAFYSDEMLKGLNHFHSENQEKFLVHPQVGSQMLSLTSEWQEAAEIVLQHHERPDGKGFPVRMKGDQICMGAKILAIATHFDLLIHGRDAHIQKHSTLRAVAEINARSGTQFDKAVVEAFNKMIRNGYANKSGIGSVH